MKAAELASDPLILLPPSEGKAPGGAGPTWRRATMADSGLDRHRSRLLPAARRAGATKPRAATMPAIERYQGVLYRELDWFSLDIDARHRGASQVRIVSGLWGLVSPVDPIPNYKLKMSAALDGFGRLSTWWQPRMAPVLAELSAGRVVWDLLPQEHARACAWSDITPTQRVTVRFVDHKDRTVSHWNKLLKGALVRWLLTKCPTGPADLAAFEHPAGYQFDPESSDLDGSWAQVVMRAG